MNQSFREFHLFSILQSFEATSHPLDAFLSRYFRSHPAVGSKDRKMISDTIYGMIRWKGLLDHIAKPPLNWQSRFKAFTDLDPSFYQQQDSIPPHVRVSFPKAYFQLLEEHYGEAKAMELCLSCNTTAPLTLRVNTLKTSRDALLQKWQGQHEATPCKFSPWGIHFPKKNNFFAMQEFKDGLFEVQDEGSQLISQLVKAKPKEQVLDYCAGAGGKSLSLGAIMQNTGQLYLYDIRLAALQEAKKRLSRAGVQNAQMLDPSNPKLKNKMDWVLVDVPCTGSGTLRRNPDLKWKFKPDTLEQLVQEQRQIFEQALTFLKPNGKIVYATCSIFSQENEDQIAYFQEKYGLKLVDKPFSSLPVKGEMDGFFGATLCFA